MYAAALLAASVVAVLAAVRLPVRAGFALVVAAAVLVPAPLVVPNGFTGLLTVDRVLLVAFTIGLLVRARGERLRPGAFAPTPVHVAFGAFLALAVVFGLGTALPTTTTGGANATLLNLAEQFLFFIAALAAIRHIADLRWVLRLLAVVLLVSVAVALAEHVTGRSLGHSIFRRLPSQHGLDAGSPLEMRLGTVRVRAGAEFALEFAWITIALLPVLFVAVTGRDRRAGRIGKSSHRLLALTAVTVGLTLTAVYWSYSRSALIALAVAAAVFVLAARDRRALAVVGAVAAGLALVVAAAPSVLHVYTLAADQGSVAVRGQRLPLILGIVAPRPLRGTGLSGLGALGFPVTDNSYLTMYAELGALGAAAFVVLLLTAAVCAGRGMLAARSAYRRPAAAALAGVVALLAGAFVFDAFSVLGSARVFWLLAALGIVSAERSRGRLARVEWCSARRLAIPLVGAAIGGIAIAGWPVHAVASYQFSTLPSARDAGSYDPVDTGHRLIASACGIVAAEPRPGVRADCGDTFAGAGIGSLRVQAGSAAAVEQATTEIYTAVRDAGLGSFRLSRDGAIARGRPSAVDTAPAWLAVLGLGAAVLIPGRSRSRLIRGRARPGSPPPAPAPPVAARAPREPQRAR